MALINSQDAWHRACPEQRKSTMTPAAGRAGVRDDVAHTSASVAQPGLSRASRPILPVFILLALLLGPLASYGQTLVKSIQGKVLDAGTTPLAGSILYLQDTKTNVIKTLIATEDGSYRFGQLPADTDYQVWAEYKGKKSKVRLVSSFDTKRDITYNFHMGDK